MAHSCMAGVGQKFSPTLLVEEELEQLIRGALHTFCKREIIGGNRSWPHARSSSDAAAARSPRHDARATVCGNASSREPLSLSFCHS
jgi:hypothetical protein